ncbi:hypothetical protein EK904_009300 [Melospiza melodia maxima]|nr:hypothetical protein EK904_009300 [Melospiza melodia maxima]
MSDFEFHIAVMKYMGKRQGVLRLMINCTFSVHFYFELVNVKKVIATLGNCPQPLTKPWESSGAQTGSAVGSSTQSSNGALGSQHCLLSSAACSAQMSVALQEQVFLISMSIASVKDTAIKKKNNNSSPLLYTQCHLCHLKPSFGDRTSFRFQSLLPARLGEGISASQEGVLNIEIGDLGCESAAAAFNSAQRNLNK